MSLRSSALGAILLLVSTCYAWAGSRYTPVDELKAEAQASFGQVLDLWRDGKYEQVYDRSTGGNMTEQAFSRRLSSASLKPACCWQKMQDVTIRVEGDRSAVVKATLGFEGSSGVEYKTRSFKLSRYDDTWRVSRSDLLSLAGDGKKKRSQHRTRR